jgi:ankyrin repeat protein
MEDLTRGMSMDRMGCSPLHYAAADGRVDDARALIEAGADVAAPDAALMTPLHFACQQDHAAIGELLLAAGAPVDARDARGKTPLHVAVFAFQGDPRLIRALLAAGADPDAAASSGKSPRGLAAMIGNRPGLADLLA